jgi:hypothetical protein
LEQIGYQCRYNLGITKPTLFYLCKLCTERICKTRLEIKFGCDDDLTSFQDAVMDHLIDMGMDSISYLPDPKDAIKND